MVLAVPSAEKHLLERDLLKLGREQAVRRTKPWIGAAPAKKETTPIPNVPKLPKPIPELYRDAAIPVPDTIAALVSAVDFPTLEKSAIPAAVTMRCASVPDVARVDLYCSVTSVVEG